MAGVEESLGQLAKRARGYGASLATEEATKNAIVMPFISQVLGYDVFNPEEVIPEFVADLGLKKGEKIDYAIKHADRVHMLIEVKKVGEELSLAHASQLVRYFHTSDARIGVLTNGLDWRFYTDLDKPNIMDERPFLQLDLNDIDPSTLPHLTKMTKAAFDLDSVIAAAEELKYVSAIKREIADEISSPSEDFVRLFTKRVYHGYLNARAVEQFTVLTEKAAKQYINDRVNARLKTALADQAPLIGVSPEVEATTSVIPSEGTNAPGENPQEKKPDISTTEEELEAFRIVRAIVAGIVPAQRVFIRDAQSYCSVFLDDNNRKPIVRLYFNGRIKRLGVFDANKDQVKVDIETLEDIYGHAEVIRQIVAHYVSL
ncbi:type I restriction endonuclease [Austwickia chelonae]|uniref:type I restriction endonuclease n=1 Tax=Austwickia chelonae TaxID=100225 RepID=UPI000E232CA6|nr:type I restriction enzyme HsdR N-terminal domain-containing protein [Austwickia chelonae]